MFKALRVLFSRRKFEAGMERELEFHMEQRAQELQRSGLAAEEAGRRARLEMGGLNSAKENCRRARGLPVFDELGRELRCALRLLRKTPAFTATALLTVALCLGANLAIFAVIDSILLRPLPFPDAGQLVTVFNTYPKAGVDRDGASVTNYYERRGKIPAFTSLSIYSPATAIVGAPGATVRENVMQVSPDFFQTLQRGPVLGRPFTDAETTYQTNRVVILTDSYWRQHFNGDPHVVGKQIRVDGVPDTVVGVLPAGFRFLASDARLYFPLASRLEDRTPLQRHSGGNVRQLIARLRPGASMGQAQAQIDTQNNELERDDPQGPMMAAAGFRSLVVGLQADQVAAVRPTLVLLQAGALLLLLIGAVNLINLLFIRASGRTKETAVRQALGAGRLHLASEALVENLLLMLGGGALALAVGAAGIRLLAAWGVDRLPLGSEISFGSAPALAALAAALAMGVVFAAAICWFNLRISPGTGMQSETRGGTAGRAAQTLRHSFVVAQIALAFVLLAGAGLLAASLKRVMAVAPGFRPDHVLTGEVSLPGRDYPNTNAQLVFIDRLTAAMEHVPGVVAAGVANNVPLSGHSGKSAAAVVGYVQRPGESPRGHYSYGVGGDYFRAMGFTLLAGRSVSSEDSVRLARVCVVDADFARHYWPNSSPLGRRLFDGSSIGPAAQAFTVVGVVASVKQASLGDESAQGAVYYPYAFRADDHIFVALRTIVPPQSVAPTLKREVRQLDANLPVNNIKTMEERVDQSLQGRRSPALLAGIFSGIALLLTAIGSYGVLSYAVAQRRREIAVRMALGAQPEQIRAQFLGLALRLLAGGTLLGVAGAWLTGRAMRALLFQAPPLPWGTLMGTAVLLLVVCLAACLVPARRAARISPMQTLSEQ
jgi:predicted permease